MHIHSSLCAINMPFFTLLKRNDIRFSQCFLDDAVLSSQAVINSVIKQCN